MRAGSSNVDASRVLVAGASGYLGGFVLRELAGRGHATRALVRSASRIGPIPAGNVEVVEAEVTRRESLEHVCDGIDVVFSSIGVTRQRDGLSFHDVDFRGNRNLLDAAIQAGVRRFVYVSVLNGPRLRHLDIVDAHEAFVDELRRSGLEYAVVRPSGFFSDLGEVVEMARRGRVWLIGPGSARVNPIHGADLAAVCADAVEGDAAAVELDVGGPQIMTWDGIAAAAFEAIGRRPRITHVPTRLAWCVVRLVRRFDRHRGELLAFFTTAATSDAVAPTTGVRTVQDHFDRLARAGLSYRTRTQLGRKVRMA